MRYVRTQLECKHVSVLTAWFFVAGRAADEVVRVPMTQIPYWVRESLTVGKIVHAKMLIGVPRNHNVAFVDWETT